MRRCICAEHLHAVRIFWLLQRRPRLYFASAAKIHRLVYRAGRIGPVDLALEKERLRAAAILYAIRDEAGVHTRCRDPRLSPAVEARKAPLRTWPLSIRTVRNLLSTVSGIKAVAPRPRRRLHWKFTLEEDRIFGFMRWRWSAWTRAGEPLMESSEGFALLRDCEEDARRHGYTAPESTFRTKQFVNSR